MRNVVYDRIAKHVTDKTTDDEFVKLFNTIGTDRQVELTENLLKERQKEWTEACQKKIPFESFVVGSLVRLETAYELHREMADAQMRFAEEFARREEEKAKEG